ncbi:hypothetical protein TNCV_4819491 [Trichonephila clavipes]|nr:hypothetical protein TNCV_4819491 [Trichonephila clavipes]
MRQLMNPYGTVGPILPATLFSDPNSSARKKNTAGEMDKCVQKLDKNYGALVQTARECFCVLRTNRTRKAERDFCGLPIRDEGRVVDSPLVFKKVFFRRREECLGWRELDESFKERRTEIRVERTERR